MKYKLSDIAEFNPRESINKGSVAKKVAMDKLQPFCRDIPSMNILNLQVVRNSGMAIQLWQELPHA